MTDTDANKRIITEFIQRLFSQGDLAAVDDYLSNDFVNHDPPFGASADREGMRSAAAGILKEERDIAIASPPLEATSFQVGNIRWTYVFYESGLSINVLYPFDEPKKRAVGFKLSEGMEVPAELGSFRFARQKSKLAGTIRGSYFVIKGEY